MININSYKNKNIGVVGFGQTGRSIVDALKSVDANIILLDRNIIDNSYYKNIDEVDWRNLDALVVSPGIHLWWDIDPSIKLARRFSIPIINDIDIFQQHVNSKIIAVTGTNGKSTTTALIHHILSANFKSEIGGNFGIPVLSLSDQSDFYVFELSSYQLESCNILGFDTSILLNITPDHLTRHGGMSGYIASKQKIFANPNKNSIAIVSIDDEYCRHLLDLVYHPHIIKISGKEIPGNGVGWSENKLIDNRNNQHKIICEKYDLLDGNHNRQNIATAYAACSANGISVEDFRNGLFSFRGLEHRQEFVASIEGVRYINDSKATNADSVEQAFKRYQKIIWIAGGRPKEDGIEKLIPYFEKINYALLIGEAAEDWHKILNENHVKNEIVFTLEKAIKKAHEIAKSGEVVLLSPACASFDQFKSFEERGKQFKQMVGKLKC